MRIVIAIVAACFTTAALAEDLVTTKGKTYQNVRISEVEADGITFFHTGGVVKIPFSELSPELQKKHGYDPRRAAQAAAADAAQQARLAEQGRKEAVAARIKQVESDIRHAEAVAEIERRRIASSRMAVGSSLDLTPQEKAAQEERKSEFLARRQELKRLREEWAIIRGH